MKKAIIIPIMLGLLLSSCGTATKYASVTFDDAVYQKPGSNKYIVVNTEHEQELAQLREKTQKSEQAIVNGRIVEPLYVDEQGNVEITLDEEKSYIILHPGESFEERLRKFDSPDYRINITVNPMWAFNYYPWDYFWNPYSWRMYGRMFGYHHFMPFGYRYYDPWNYNYYYGYFSIDPFIGMGPMWFNHFNYHHSMYGYYYNPFYYGDHYWWYSRWNRNFYYDNYRETRPYYGDRRDPNRGSIRVDSQDRNYGSSSMRRSSARVEQVRGENVYTGSESIYRRESRYEGVGVQTGNNRASVESGRRGNTDVNRSASTGTVRRTNSEVNRGATEVNRNQSSGEVRRNTGVAGSRSGYEGTVRRTNTEVNRGAYEGYSARPNSQVSRGTTGNNQAVRESQNYRGSTSGTVRQPVSSGRSSGTVNQSQNYRPSAVQPQNQSSSRNSSYSQPTRNTSSGSNVSRSSSYTPPPSSNTSSNTSSSSSSTSSGSSGSSSSGSGYRR